MAARQEREKQKPKPPFELHMKSDSASKGMRGISLRVPLDESFAFDEWFRKKGFATKQLAIRWLMWYARTMDIGPE